MIARPWLIAAIVLLSLTVRVAHLASVYSTPAFSFHLNFVSSDMYLFDQWAQKIVAGDTLGRQTYHPIVDWMLHTAPAAQWTQWFGEAPVFLKAPLYAYLVAVCRWRFGDPMLAMAILQMLASTTSAVLLFLITERLFADRTAGVLAGLFFAIYAPAVHYDVVLLRGPWIVLVGLLVTWQLVRLQARPTARGAWGLGVTTGFALLINEGSLPLPLLIVLLLAWWVGDMRQLLSLGGAFALGLVTVLTPLVVRNVVVGVPPFSLAVTGSYALAMHDSADANPIFFRGPGRLFLPLMEQSGGRFLKMAWLCIRSFDGVGDFFLFYLRRSTGLIAPFEVPDNFNFYYAVLKNPLLGWLPGYAVLFPIAAVGFVLAARKRRNTQPLLPMALTLMASLMMTLPLSRYRLTLLVFLFPFAGAALAQLLRWGRQRRFLILDASVAAMVLVSAATTLLQRHVVFRSRDPAGEMYRNTEFIIAAITYERAGQLREAGREVSQLAQSNPSAVLRKDALLLAGQYYARAGDAAEARASLERLSAIAPRDARVQLTIGDVYLDRLHDQASALTAYRQAEALRPSGQVGRTLRERLARLAAAPES